MGSGQKLLNLLSRIGYQSSVTLQHSDFDWVFDNPETSEFVEAICASISEENVLTSNEMEEFDEMVNSGQRILEGKILEESLKSVVDLENVNDDCNEDPRVNREEIEIIERQLTELKSHCKVTFSENNRLSFRLMYLNQKKLKLSRASRNAEQKLKEKKMVSANLSSKLNNTMKDVSKNMLDLQKLFNVNLCPLFLSSIPFEKLYRLENSFMVLINEYIQKQFFQKIDFNITTNGKFNSQLLSLALPELVFIKGYDLKEHKIIQDEINRLLTVCPQYETERILAESKIEEKKSIKNFMLEHVTNFDEFCAKVPPLQTVKSGHNLKRLEQEYLDCTNNDLKDTLSSCVEAEQQLFLSANYDEKLVQQQYLISKQDIVVNMLLKQKSLRIFLTMLLELENRSHIAADNLLSQIQNYINKEADSLNRRTEALKSVETSLKSDAADQRAPSQESLSRVQKLLGPGCADSSSSPEEILSSCKDFTKNRDDLDSIVNSAIAKNINKVLAYEQSRNLLESAIHGKTGELIWRSTNGIPDEIVTEMAPLKRAISSVEHKLNAIQRDYAEKQQTLELCPELKEERSLFVRFCNHPEAFKEAIESKISMLRVKYQL